MFCRFCGNKISDDCNFCPKCGESLNNIVRHDANEAEQSDFNAEQNNVSRAGLQDEFKTVSLQDESEDGINVSNTELQDEFKTMYAEDMQQFGQNGNFNNSNGASYNGNNNGTNSGYEDDIYKTNYADDYMTDDYGSGSGNNSGGYYDSNKYDNGGRYGGSYGGSGNGGGRKGGGTSGISKGAKIAMIAAAAVIVLAIASILIFSGDNKTVTNPPTEDNPIRVGLNIADIKLPAKYSEFSEKTGYKVSKDKDGKKINSNTKIAGIESLKDVEAVGTDGEKVALDIENFSEKEEPLDDCYVTKLKADNNKNNLIEDDGVRFGMDKKAVKEKLGEPDEESDGNLKYIKDGKETNIGLDKDGKVNSMEAVYPNPNTIEPTTTQVVQKPAETTTQATTTAKETLTEATTKKEPVTTETTTPKPSETTTKDPEPTTTKDPEPTAIKDPEPTTSRGPQPAPPPPPPTEAAAAYLKLLDEKADLIKDSENSMYNSNFSVAFLDITGDDVEEMFYTYYDEADKQCYCKIASYEEGEMVYITYEDGRDIFIAGAGNGTQGCIFTKKGSENIFVKSGTVAGHSFDSITEFEYGEGILKSVHNVNYGINAADVEDMTIDGKDASKEEVLEKFGEFSGQIDKVLINSFGYLVPDVRAAVGGTQDFTSKEAAFTFTEAKMYLKPISEGGKADSFITEKDEDKAVKDIPEEEQLELALGALHNYPHYEYSYLSGAEKRKALVKLLYPYIEGIYYPFDFYKLSDPATSEDEKYLETKEEDVSKIAKNIFNISDDEIKSFKEDVENGAYSSDVRGYGINYKDGKYMINVGNSEMGSDNVTKAVIKNVYKDGDIYFVEYNQGYYLMSDADEIEEEPALVNPETFYAILKLNEIDGKKTWSIYYNGSVGYSQAVTDALATSP